MKKIRLKRIFALMMACLLVLGVMPGESYYGYSFGVIKADEASNEQTSDTDADLVVKEVAPEDTDEQKTSDSGISSEKLMDAVEETPSDEVVLDASEETTEKNQDEPASGDTAASAADEVTLGILDSVVVEDSAEDESETQETACEPSDGSLAGLEVCFEDMTGAVSKLYAKFDGGADEPQEAEFLPIKEGYFAGQIPEGDYSRISFSYENKDGMKITLRPYWHFCSGETALENTKSIELESNGQNVFYYVNEPEYQYDAETDSYYVTKTDSYWKVTVENPADETESESSADTEDTGETETENLTEEETEAFTETGTENLTEEETEAFTGTETESLTEEETEAFTEAETETETESSPGTIDTAIAGLQPSDSVEDVPEPEIELSQEMMNEPSDGSLAGTEIYFSDMAESVSKLYAKFDGGIADSQETEFVLNEEGYFAGQIPEGDYSRITFRYEKADGTQVTIRPYWHYYAGETALENTEVIGLDASGKNVFCFVSEPELQYETETDSYYVADTGSYWEITPGEETETETETEDVIEVEDRVIEPSEGYWAGETMNFVNLFWEDQDLGDVYAVFQGGTEADQEILMTQGDRGKYSVTIPEGDYSRVSFCRLLEEKSEEAEVLAEDETEDPGENTYQTYGTPFQYYGEESAVEECVPVLFMTQARDTFYYDTVNPERSYWGADALFEGEVGGISTFALTDSSRDQAGNILYFVDLSPDDKTHVKRVTMQFFDAVNGADKVESVMYEGRDGIFSAPIPEGGREEVTFRMEFDDGTAYQIVRHFNIYEEGSTNAAENFIYAVSEMDAFFFNNVHDQVGYDEIADCYWGPHPSVTNRSLAAQYFYVDTTDRNGNGIYLDPATLTIDYGTGDVGITQYTRNPDIRYYQFPVDCSATEQTILTLKGKLAYNENYTGKEEDKTNEEITFRFCYPYNSNKRMIVADNLREFKPLFEEFNVADTEKTYVIYDNTTTQFTNIQYRVRTETGDWPESWTNLVKTNPDEWTGKPSEAVVQNLWGVEVSSDCKYVQFRGTNSAEPQESNDYLWYSTKDTTSENTLARIPSDTISYPCFYGMKTNGEGNEDENTITINGVWMSALEIRNLGDSSYEIPSDGKFEKEQNAYYGTSTFYDYYTDPELNGIKLSEILYDSMIPNKVNTALSSYYEQNNVANGVYIGNVSNSDNLYKYDSNINNWERKRPNYVTSGAVGDTLANGNMLTTSNGTISPLFNELFLRGNNSLSTNLGKVYNNVYFPFIKNESGYWEFDSNKTEQTLRLNYDVNHGYFLKRTGEQFILHDVADIRNNSFFPFNGSKDQKQDQYPQQKTNDYLNYLFGVRLEIPFTLPEGNEVVMQQGENAEPVTFTFTGDDDAWVFVDGNLLLDLGGIHDCLTGTINFKTGEAIVNAAGDKIGKELTRKFSLDPTIEIHTLTMYYMERGKGSSNLKLTFNFPKQNALNVTNEIDTSAANSIFRSALDNIGSFAYKIANKVTSGNALDVERSAGYVTPGDNIVFSEEKYVIEIKQDTGLNSGNTDQEIISKLNWFTADTAADISNQAYLRFQAYNESDEKDNAGESIFVAFKDSAGNIIGGWASRLAYGGSSNALGNNEWSLVRVDINKLQFMDGATTFDRTGVIGIGFAARYADPVSVKVKNLKFYQPVNISPSHGFSVEEDKISDYGSVRADGNILSDANGAWYGYYRAGLAQSIYRMVENGFFSVGDGERAEFIDKFRVGSYLQITQEHIDPDVFDTFWSIREGVNQDIVAENSLVVSRTDIQKVKNTGEPSSLEDNTGLRPDDGRIAKIDGQEITRPEDGSIVYRGYENPDDNEMNPVNLTVAFKNVLKTGSITINKTIEMEGENTAIGAEFRFDIIFTNIAGMGLNDAPIVQPVKVVITDKKWDSTKQKYVYTGTATFDGIPAGTEYEIREHRQIGFKLDELTPGETVKHREVEVVNDKNTETMYAKGIVYASDQEFNFKNIDATTEMEIEKHWEGDSDLNERPSAIGIRIMRREGDSTEWVNVTGEVSAEKASIVKEGENAPYIKLCEENALQGNENIWVTKINGLPIYSEEGKIYTYEIQEVKAEGENSWKLDNYVKEYIQGDPVTGKYIVTNTPNAIEVRKKWEDGEDEYRPIAVRVQLQRKLEGQSEDQYENVGFVDLSANGRPKWTHTFQNVPRVNEEGKKYVYRAVETHLIYATAQEGGTKEIEVDSSETANGYKVTYSTSEDNTILTITNTKEAGQVVLLKKDRSDNKTPLSGAVFKLERLKPRDEQEGAENTFETGQYNNKYWTADKDHSSVQLTTDKDGKIDFGYLPFGYYRVTEIKAPEGYILLDNPYDFHIDQDALDEIAEKEPGITYMTLEITNQSAITLPISGAAGTMMFTLAGLILLASALLMYKLHLQKTRKRARG